MTDGTLQACFTLLSTMACGREQEWSDRLRPVYALALRNLDDDTGKRAVEYAVLHETWRPAPARLLEIAAEIASPIPDAEAVYGEIARKVQTEGVYARPHPDRPSIKLEGPPPFSHPIVERIVHYCGGWPMICNGESNFAEGLKKQVRGAHDSVSAEWREKVKRQLTLPAVQRDRRMFPQWKPFALPEDWTPEYQLPAIEPPRFDIPDASELPPAIRSQIAAIAAKRMFPPPSAPNRVPGKSRMSKPEDLTADDRQRIEAELQAGRADPAGAEGRSAAADNLPD